MYGQWGVPGYTEVRELGTGASGRVVLASRDHDGAQVAIKYLSDDLRADVGFVARFRHEARLLGTMRSPYNARLIDYVETGEGAAIIMELVNGVALRELLSSEGPTGPEAALVVLKGALQGLAAAHAIGVVHRDFKPENVIVQGDGASKLVDFGIAVRSGQGTSAAGTPPYMAPEQWSGAPAAPTTDVYAATVVFFECLTGARPYRATNLAALARQHHSTPPPVDEVPAPLQGLVERGLAKHPSERPPSAEALLTELEAVAAEAYGSDWEERGKRRLAVLAGLLVMLFPNQTETAELSTTVTETRFGEPSQLLTKVGAKVALGAVCVGVLVGVAVVVKNVADNEPVLQAQTTQTTPSGSETPLEVPTPGETTEEATEEATPTEAATTPEPDPTTTTTAALPITSTTPPPTTTTPALTPKPTKKPTKKPTSKASPTETPDEGITGRSSADETVPPTAPPTSATPTPTPPPVTTSTPPRTPTEPTPTTDDGGEEPSPTLAKLPPTVLALGLMTSGALPVTLAVKRRVAGRHRRKKS